MSGIQKLCVCAIISRDNRGSPRVFGALTRGNARRWYGKAHVPDRCTGRSSVDPSRTRPAAPSGPCACPPTRCSQQPAARSSQEHAALYPPWGSKRCQTEGCTKAADIKGDTPHCKAHGGGKRCLLEGCTKRACQPRRSTDSFGFVVERSEWCGVGTGSRRMQGFAGVPRASYRCAKKTPRRKSGCAGMPVSLSTLHARITFSSVVMYAWRCPPTPPYAHAVAPAALARPKCIGKGYAAW